MKLSDHMELLWREIGYKPSNYVHKRDENDEKVEEVSEKSEEFFTPEYKREQPVSSKESLAGVSVRGFPAYAKETDMIIYLEKNAMPKSHQSYSINRYSKSSTVDVEDLSKDSVETMEESISKRPFDNKPLTVKRIMKLKELNTTGETQEEISTPPAKPENEKVKNQLAEALEENVNKIPGLSISPEEKKEALQKMKKASLKIGDQVKEKSDNEESTTMSHNDT